MYTHYRKFMTLIVTSVFDTPKHALIAAEVIWCVNLMFVVLASDLLPWKIVNSLLVILSLMSIVCLNIPDVQKEIFRKVGRSETWNVLTPVANRFVWKTFMVGLTMNITIGIVISPIIMIMLIISDLMSQFVLRSQELFSTSKTVFELRPNLV